MASNPKCPRDLKNYRVSLGMAPMVGSAPFRSQILLRTCPFPPGPVSRLEFQARTFVREHILNTELAAACLAVLPESRQV